jgi:hypothetical protein
VRFSGNAVVPTMILVWLLTIPTNAQTPTKSFDGVYNGVSDQMTAAQQGQMCRIPPPNPVPPQLTITNGVAQTKALGGLEGTVNSQGMLVMHSSNSAPLQAQIDAQGTVRGRLAGIFCIWQLVWQKK